KVIANEGGTMKITDPQLRRELQQSLLGRRPLPRSLESVSRATLAAALDVELPPVDDGSQEGADNRALYAPRPVRVLDEEAIIQLGNRPSMLVQRNPLVAPPESDTWRRRVEVLRPVVEPTLRSVGRIELLNDDELDWCGTAWMVSERHAVTNRHVASLFASKR